jgi:metal-responsive CopG/Arc/MetJ family transcriptional regulator
MSRCIAVSRETLSITLPENLVTVMDTRRGALPRSWWVEEAVRAYAGMPAKPSTDATTVALLDAEESLKKATQAVKALRKKLQS